MGSNITDTNKRKKNQMTHQVKECTERPRKVGAKYTQKEIARDEYDLSGQKIATSFEAKRDRWNGYNTQDYKE